MANMINTSECEKCNHSVIDETNKARIKVYCQEKGKTYYWGQCIPCEYNHKKEGRDVDGRYEKHDAN